MRSDGGSRKRIVLATAFVASAWSGFGWAERGLAAGEPCVEQWADALQAYDPLRAHAMVSFDDGTGERLFVGGHGEHIAHVASSYIASYDGEQWHPVGEGFDDSVAALAIYDDGSGPALYASGSFTMSGDTVVNHIARWDGEAWRPVGDGLDAWYVDAMTVYDDGSGAKLVVAFNGPDSGEFTRIDMWDGQHWQNLVDEMNGDVRAMISWDDGDGPALYVGGRFNLIAGVEADGLTRYRDGAWSELGEGLGGPYYNNGSTNDLAIYDDGAGEALFVTGWFDGAGDCDAANIAKWTGSDWQVVNGWTTGQPYEAFDEMAVLNEGAGAALYIARTEGKSGSYRWDGETATLIGDHGYLPWRVLTATGLLGGRLAFSDSDQLYFYDPMTQQWETHYAEYGQAFIKSMIAHDDGTGAALYAAGLLPGGVLRWAGEDWQTLSGLSSDVEAITSRANDDDPLLYATGQAFFGDYNSGQVAAWNGSEWLPLGTGLEDAYVSWGTSLAVHERGDGHDLYVSGRFTSAGGVPAYKIARWDGTQWHALGNGLGDEADLMVVADTGDGPMLYVIGGFAGVDSEPAGYIAAWDGSDWRTLQGGFDHPPTGMAVVHEDGRDVLFVVGEFTTAGGMPIDGFAKWDGERWLSAGAKPDGTHQRLFVLDTPAGPQLFAATRYYLGDGEWEGRAWRLQSGAWIELGLFDQRPFAMETFDDGSGPALFVGGYFDHVDDIWARGIARRNLCDPDDIAADINGDGVVDQMDLGLLLQAYGTCAGDDFYNPDADLTGDDCVDQQDLGALLQAYEG